MATDKDQRVVEIILKAQDANASLKEMGAGAAVMNAQLGKMGQDDPGRAKLLTDLQTLNGRITEQRNELRQLIPTQKQQEEQQEKVRQAAEAERQETERLQAAQEQLNRERVESIAQGKLATASLTEMEKAASLVKVELSGMAADDPGRAALQRDFTLLEQRIKAARTEMNTYVKTAAELEEEQRQLAAETERVNRENVQVVVNGKKVTATYNEMEAAAKQLEKEIKDLVPGTKEFIDKSKDLKEVRGRMDEVTAATKNTEKSAWLAALGLDGITAATVSMKAAFTAAMTALLPLLAVGQLWEMVKGFVGLVEEIDHVKLAVTQATGAQGEMLDEITAKTRALSATFGDEWNEVLKAGDVLAKQMGISHKEAFDLIEQGYLAGANRSGEMIDQITEYSVQLKAAGFSAEEFMVLMTKSELGGVFSDKGVDAVKEFGLRIREQTTATQDALDKAFGREFTDRIFNGVKDGSLTVKQAMVEVSKAMSDTSVDAARLQTVVADVWGGPGEDAGTAFLQSLKDVGGGMQELIDTSSTYVQMQIEQQKANEMLADAEERLAGSFAGSSTQLSNLWAVTKTYVYNGISAFVEGMEKMRASVMGSISYLGSWSLTVGRVFMMLKTGDFSGAKDAFGRAGKEAADAYQEAYNKSLEQGRKQREAGLKMDKKPAEDAAAAAEQKLKIEQQELTRKEQEAADKKAETDRKRAHDKKVAEEKKHAAELKKAREDAEKAQLAATQAAEDMQVAAIKDKYEREIQGINLQTNRKMAALAGSEEQIMAQWEMMETARQERIAQVREKQKEDEEKRKQEALDKRVEQEQLDAEVQAAELALKFEQGLLAEYAYQEALYNLKAKALDNQLALVREKNGEESAQYKKITAEKLKNEADHVKKEKDLKEDLRKFEMNMARMSATLLADGFALVEENLNKKTVAYQIFKNARKMAEIAEVGINLQAELQANAKAASQNALNGTTFGAAGITQLAISNGLSIARALGAGIKIAAFEKGGNTMRPADIFSVDQLAGLLAGTSGGSFASGGPVKQPTLGLIGEAGAELVIPNWLYSDPRQADLMGFLEAQIASRGQAFANGGSTVPDFSVAAPAAGDTSITNVLSEMVAAVRELNGRLIGVEEWQRDLKVNNNLQEVREGLETINQVRTGGGIRKR